MSDTWASGPLCGFDIESTGVDPTTDRIVTASVVLVHNGQPVFRDWLADPGVEIPAAATAVHKITTEHARSHGRPASDVIVEVAEHLERAWKQEWPVVAFNAPYDLTMLHYELIRHCDDKGLILLTPPGCGIGPVIDPFVLDRHVDRYRRGSRKLSGTCVHYGVSLTAAHSSGADAYAAAQLACALAEQYPQVGSMTLDELQDAQAQWYRESQWSFAEYLRSKVAQQVLSDAIAIRSRGEREAKLAELSALLSRADSIVDNADDWPFRATA